MRYDKEVHLKFFGPREECASRIPNARVFLAEALVKTQDAGTPGNFWVRKEFPDGSSYRAWLGEPPVLEIHVPPPGGDLPPELRLQVILPWEPEGFLLTPVSTLSPDGEGLPIRDPTDPLATRNPTYTVGGVYPQVLVNRFANNKYLDDLDYMEGLPSYAYGLFPRQNRQLRDAMTDAGDGSPIDDTTIGDTILWEYATLLGGLASYKNYMPGNEPPEGFDLDNYYEFEDEFDQLNGGVFELNLQYQVVDGQTLPYVVSTRIADRDSVTEPEDTTIWYSHRPEEMVYRLALFEGIYQSVNTARLANEPSDSRFLRPLRGFASPGYWGALELGTSIANYWGHSHPDFRPGLRTAGGRNVMTQGQEPGQNTANNPCENALVIASITPGTSLTMGDEVNQYWINSPGHYSVMINPVWEPDVRLFHYTASKDLAFCDGASLEIGSYGVEVNYDTYFGVNDPSGDQPFWNEITWTFGDSLGQMVFTQVYQQKETWLPAPEWTTSTYAGTIGLYSNPNVWAGLPNTHIRRFTLGSRSYEVPPGNYPPFLDAVSSIDPSYPTYDDATDVFMGLSLIHISEPTRLDARSRMPSSA